MKAKRNEISVSGLVTRGRIDLTERRRALRLLVPMSANEKAFLEGIARSAVDKALSDETLLRAHQMNVKESIREIKGHRRTVSSQTHLATGQSRPTNAVDQSLLSSHNSVERDGLPPGKSVDNPVIPHRADDQPTPVTTTSPWVNGEQCSTVTTRGRGQATDVRLPAPLGVGSVMSPLASTRSVATNGPLAAGEGDLSASLRTLPEKTSLTEATSKPAGRGSIKTDDIRIRVSPEEKAQIQRLAELAGMTVTRLITMSVIEGRSSHVRQADPQLIYHVNRIGVNLNQIAHKCNFHAKAGQSIDVLEVLREIREIKQSLEINAR